ncbi:818_t:CDS:1, partial [Dentiscutata erythropus]
QPIQSSKSVGETIAQRVRGLVDMLPVIRQAAIFQVQKAQNRQKQLHNRKIQNITELGIEEKVLVYRASRQYNRSVKLELKWLGSYYIHQVFDWNVIKLRTMEGQVVSTPISTSLIKKYRDRQRDTEGGRILN